MVLNKEFGQKKLLQIHSPHILIIMTKTITDSLTWKNWMLSSYLLLKKLLDKIDDVHFISVGFMINQLKFKILRFLLFVNL